MQLNQLLKRQKNRNQTSQTEKDKNRKGQESKYKNKSYRIALCKKLIIIGVNKVQQQIV